MADVTMTTYKRADGELIWGDYAHVSDLEFDAPECPRPNDCRDVGVCFYRGAAVDA